MRKTSIIIIICAISFAAFVIGFFYSENKNNTQDFITTNRSNTETNTFTIVAFGDSLTAGYRLPLNESYPATLEKAIAASGKMAKVINAGVSGETSRGNLERAEFIRKQNPDMIILGIGGNDALRGLSIQEFEQNFSKTIEILSAGTSSPKIFILRMQAPENAGKEYKVSFDAVYTDVSKKYSLPIIDFLIPEVFLNQSLMLDDGIHPNKDGYKVLVETKILPSIMDFIQ